MRIAGLLSLLVLLCQSLGAQASATASITGRITDQTGYRLPGASVKLVDSATGSERVYRSDAEGNYALTSLQPGTYQLKVTVQGFADWTSPVELHVGQGRVLDVSMRVAAPSETVITTDDRFLERSLNQVTGVDSVIRTEELDDLPLNGRNYLELSFLVPGNSPAPNFDPTKTNSVIVSSAGQLGRGGNVTIDGVDNNDDVVGGPLQNISQEAVQEFQIATNRFSAALGRTGSTAINVVTKSGTNEYHGSASVFVRDSRVQGLPATLDRSVGSDFPFDRQQYAGSVGGPLKPNKAWWFASVENRNQDGALLVGVRDPAARAIRREFAAAPLDDLIGTGRVDWNPGEADTLNFRFSGQRSDDTAASTLIRALGSPSQRQQSENQYKSVGASWNRVFSPTLVNNLSFGESNFSNVTDPVTPGPQFTFPSLQDGASFRVPQQTRQNRLQFSDSVDWIRGSHRLKFGGEVQKIDASFLLDVFREGRIEFVEDFAPFDRNGDGSTDDNDLLFAVTLRSAFPDRSLDLPDADNTHIAFFIQDDFRVTDRLSLNFGLRYELDSDVKNVSRYDEINPLVQPFLSGSRGRDTNNWGPRVGLNWATENGRTSLHAGYGIYYDRIVLEIQSLERGLDGRALPVEVRAGNFFFLDPESGTLPPVAPDPRRIRSRGFCSPAPEPVGSTSSMTTCRTPWSSSSTLGWRNG